MKLEEFREVIRRRIPTPQEFVSVVEGQGWKVVAYDDGKASLRCKNTTDPLALALAKMLGREPYRTNVLKVVKGKAPLTPAIRQRQWLWVAGNYYEEAAWVAAMPQYRDKHPLNAAWWRWKGDTDWQALPPAAEGGDLEAALAEARKKGHDV